MNRINIHTLSENCNKNDVLKSINLESGIEFEYISDFTSSKILRDFIGVICDKYHFNAKLKSQMILIADEMNNNAIEHGSLIWEKNYLRLLIEAQWDYLFVVLEVEDSGNGKTHKSSLEMETLRAHQLKKWYNDHHSIRGRWLFMLIVKLVDRLYFKDSIRGGLIVGIKKKIKT